MKKKYASVHIKDETLRDGLQIEDASIPVSQRIKLLDMLSETGLTQIMIGSFVSPKYTPQMKDTELVASGFTPKPGVKYMALIPNERGHERAEPYRNKLSPGLDAANSTGLHMCDVFTRRNWNRSQADEIAVWPARIEAAKARGAKEAIIGTNATFGSNFTGETSAEARMALLTRQHEMWTAAGIPVTGCSMADPMSWCMPHKVEEAILAVKEKWPSIRHWRLHVHDGRGMAIPSIYAALRVLGVDEHLYVESTLGGIGGCPYCGNGRAAGMAPTEDLVHMLTEMGIETGVDLKKVIEAVWYLEEMLGRPTMGHVSKAGPFPHKLEELYDPNMPFVETHDQAKHFIKGPSVYEGGISPWSAPIESGEQLDAVRAALRTQAAAE